MVVYVVGSLNEDVVVSADRLPLPGETVAAISVRTAQGGKGFNQACAIARLGIAVELVGCVGSDNAGSALLRQLRVEGVGVTGVDRVQAPSGKAFVHVDPAGENMITVVSGANAMLTDTHVTAALSALTSADVVLAQAEISTSALNAASEAAMAAGATFVLNIAPYRDLPEALLASANPLIANETEAALCARSRGLQQSTAAGLKSVAKSVIVTLGSRGSEWASDEGNGEVRASAVPEVRDTTGAGDAYVGAFVAGRISGLDIADAIAIATVAAGASVASQGTVTSYLRAPSPRDLLSVATASH